MMNTRKTLHNLLHKRYRRVRAFAPVLLVIGLSLVGASQSRAQSYTYGVLYSFNVSPDGKYPYSQLLLDKNANLYGTTSLGGTYGFGTVYELSATGVETVLHSFPAPGGWGMQSPQGGLTPGIDGTFYGTTLDYVFKLDSDGNLTVLHTFLGQLNRDGLTPKGNLVRDALGNLYGCTQFGGWEGNKSGLGHGTIFKLDQGGNETVLRAFLGPPLAEQPLAGLILDQAGNLYGTSVAGGRDLPFAGTVFKVDPKGVETVLHSFRGKPDGASPYAALIRDSAGNVYGTTSSGGSFDQGAIFKLNIRTLSYALLYSFGGADGSTPFAGLVEDAAGNLYGTTNAGGAFNMGTVFKLDVTGTQSVLHSFSGSPDGANPYAGLVMDRAGNLYGTTVNGGNNNLGSVFKLTLN